MNDRLKDARVKALIHLEYVLTCSQDGAARLAAAAAILAGNLETEQPAPPAQPERDPVASFLLLLRSAETIADQRISVRRRDDGQWIAITDDEVFESLSQDPTHALADLLMAIASYREACV